MKIAKKYFLAQCFFKNMQHQFYILETKYYNTQFIYFLKFISQIILDEREKISFSTLKKKEITVIFPIL